MSEKRRVLILYATKNGTTKKCANMLADKIDAFAEVTVNNLADADPPTSSYDLIVLGSPIRMGRIHKKVKKYIKNNKNILGVKPFAFYICNAYQDIARRYIVKNLPPKLREHAVAVDTFGGELNPTFQKGMDRRATEMLLKNMEKNGDDISINRRNISDFANKIKTALKKMR